MVKIRAYYERQDGEVTTRVWFLGGGILRIRRSLTGDFSEHSPIVLLTAWEDAYDALLGEERTRVQGLAPEISGNTLTCDGMTLTFDDQGCFTWSDGLSTYREVPGRAIVKSRGSLTHSFCLDSCRYYGFGEKTGNLEKTGTRMRFSGKDACGYDPEKTDPLYKHVPFFLKCSDGAVCGGFYHTAADCQLDIGKEYNGYYPPMGQFITEESEIDLFLMAGPAMDAVLERFTRLTGRPRLLPKYAYGYLGSTMFYTELPEHCDEEVLRFVDKAKRIGIPCSNFQLSSGYTTDEAGRRNVFSWNEKKFPDPQGFIKAMEDAGAPITPNIKPALLTTNPLYAEFAQSGAFIRNSDGTPYVGRFWGGQGSFVDFSNPEARKLWKHHLKRSLLEYGVHSLWNDNNEFDVPEGVCHNEGHPVDALSLRGVLPLLMNITSSQAIREVYPEKRLYQVSRSGCAGICRYSQVWTGDNRTGWDSLKWNIATMLGSGLSGMPLTGSDVGGFAGGAPEEELFIRWVNCGVLMPRFSIHSANDDNTVTEAWMYPGQMENVQRAFRLRERLLPYFYSLNYEAASTGAPIWRPMVWAFPGDQHSQYENVDFMLGSSLLSAPVVEKGAKARKVWLPQGEVFYDFTTRQRYAGGAEVTLPAGLGDIPLLQRGGSILPTQERDGIHLWICPDWDCRFVLYDDDGISNAYARGVYSREVYTLKRNGGLVTLKREKEGSFDAPSPAVYALQCVEKAPAYVRADGKLLPQLLDEEIFAATDLGWHYDHSRKLCLIKAGDVVKLEISFDKFDLIKMDV